MSAQTPPPSPGPRTTADPHDHPSAWPLPPSPLYALQATPGAGRAVVASAAIQPGTPLLQTSPALSPVAHTLFRPYRREVCGWCFAYDRGRALPARELLVSAGIVFCSVECRAAWCGAVGPLGVEAYRQLEKRERRVNRALQGARGEGEAVGEGEAGVQGGPPSTAAVQDLVAAFDTFGENAKRVRRGLVPVRDRKKTLKELAGDRAHLDADALRIVLSGVLHSYCQPRAAAAGEQSDPNQQHANAEPEFEPGQVPPSLLSLQEDPDVYKTHAALTENLETFVQLVACVPAPLLDHTSARLCHELASRASHNAFSIRPPGRTDGDQSGEYFGWGVWPEASFFNHSCAPNVAKVRDGRIWRFAASTPVAAGEHLCITYLGGDENDLDVVERRARLMEHWGFLCLCDRCVAEAGDVAGM